MTEVELDQEVRYYTPKIEEFCVGFVYQQALNAPTLWLRRVVTADTISEIDTILKLSPETIRVQYLNNGDILADGWVLNDSLTIVSHEILTHKGMVTLIKSHPDFYGLDHYTITLRENDTKNSFTLFSGIIKNLSELRTIMKMTDLVPQAVTQGQILVKDSDYQEAKYYNVSEAEVNYELFVKHMRWQRFREKIWWRSAFHGFTPLVDLGDVAIFENKTITMYDDDYCEISWVSKHYKDL